jgi:hypothetical protein
MKDVGNGGIETTPGTRVCCSVVLLGKVGSPEGRGTRRKDGLPASGGERSRIEEKRGMTSKKDGEKGEGAR